MPSSLTYTLPKRFQDLTGLVFSRLTVIEEAPRATNNERRWRCKCACGTEVIVRHGGLKSGKTQSCGCFHLERCAEARRTHGFASRKTKRNPLYGIWVHIRDRCGNRKCKQYKWYGGRRIAVCERWMKFENFYTDMAKGYRKGLFLERIDNDGDYCPENCRWATNNEQSVNKTTTRYISFNGRTHALAVWARMMDVGTSVLWTRIRRQGVERALLPAVNGVVLFSAHCL